MSLLKNLSTPVCQYQRKGTSCRRGMKNTVVFYNNHRVKSAKVLVKQLSFIILIYFLIPLIPEWKKGKARVLALAESGTPTQKAALPKDHSEGNSDCLRAHFKRNCPCQGEILFAFHSKAND